MEYKTGVKRILFVFMLGKTKKSHFFYTCKYQKSYTSVHIFQRHVKNLIKKKT